MFDRVDEIINTTIGLDLSDSFIRQSVQQRIDCDTPNPNIVCPALRLLLRARRKNVQIQHLASVRGLLINPSRLINQPQIPSWWWRACAGADSFPAHERMQKRTRTSTR